MIIIKYKKEFMMKEYYDYMRFPVKGSSDFWEVIRSGYRSYKVYNLNVERFPDAVTIFYYFIDLNAYSTEDLTEYVSNWGYESLDAFIDYLDNHTELNNHELRLCTCVIEYDTTIEPEIVFQGNFEDANRFVLKQIPSGDEIEDHDRLRC
jgi:hypothetical protein